MERISEQNGSVHCQPNHWISNVLIMTKTEPSVSAKTCRKTPEMHALKVNVCLDYLACLHFRHRVNVRDANDLKFLPFDF